MMNSNQPISNYIYFYPQVLDENACDDIIAHYNKDTFMRWKTSTFSTNTKNLGTSKVEMKEFWIGPSMFGYPTIKQGFETAVNDYTKAHDKINKFDAFAKKLGMSATSKVYKRFKI